jgi:hypothetical protein
MWATVVALVCGVVGVVAILVAVSTGHKFDHAASQVDPALAELLYDFAALQAAGMPSATPQAGFVPAPEPAAALNENRLGALSNYWPWALHHATARKDRPLRPGETEVRVTMHGERRDSPKE